MSNVYIALAVLFLWQIALTIVVVMIYRYFVRLGKGLEKGNLIDILRKVMEKEAGNENSIEAIKKIIIEMKNDERQHIQRIGFVRFNPFEELGGDHSFSAALLDGKGSGIVITGLHTRERTRVYAKDIKLGKSQVELSEEEKKAIRLAEKNI